MARDLLAGLLLANCVPHAVLGCAGKRGMTPLGRGDSSPALNLVWAGLNLGGALAVLASGSWRRAEQAEAQRRIAQIGVGMLAMTTFGTAYTIRTRTRTRTATGTPGADDGRLST